MAPGDASVETHVLGGLREELPEASGLRVLVADVLQHVEGEFPFTQHEIVPDVVDREPGVGSEAFGRQVSGGGEEVGNVHEPILDLLRPSTLIGAAARPPPEHRDSAINIAGLRATPQVRRP
jgi:hypothetical protein